MADYLMYISYYIELVKISMTNILKKSYGQVSTEEIAQNILKIKNNADEANMIANTTEYLIKYDTKINNCNDWNQYIINHHIIPEELEDKTKVNLLLFTNKCNMYLVDFVLFKDFNLISMPANIELQYLHTSNICLCEELIRSIKEISFEQTIKKITTSEIISVYNSICKIIDDYYSYVDILDDFQDKKLTVEINELVQTKN